MSGFMDLLNFGMSTADTASTGFNQFLAQIHNAQNQARAEGEIQNKRDFIYPGLNRAGSQYAGDTYRNANQANTDYRNFSGQLLGRMDAQGQGDIGEAWRYRDRQTNQANQSAGQYGQQLDSRYNRNMAYLNGSGEQERKDINTTFDNRNAANQAGLAARGFAGTTIAPQLASQNERYRMDAQGGLNERLRQQRLQTDAQLSGEAAQGRFGANQWAQGVGSNADLYSQGVVQQAGQNYNNQFGQVGQNAFNLTQQGRGATTDARYNTRMNSLNYDSGLRDQMVNLLSGINVQGPNMGNFQQRQATAGAASAPAYQPPGTDWLSPLASAGTQVAAPYAYGAGYLRAFQ